MVGQKKLLAKIDSLQKIPHSILLVGEQGSDYTGIIDYIASKVCASVIDISETVSKELIDNIYLNPNVCVYKCDLTSSDEKVQNTLLKLFEEPNAYSYIILYGSSVASLLETIVNRSYLLQMDRYSREELALLVTGDKEEILSICTTPAQVEVANHTDLAELRKLCINVVTKLNKVSPGSALNISNKLNFKDEYSKFDITLFVKMLCKVMLELKLFYLYSTLQEKLKYLYLMNDKKRYFDYIVLELWKVANNEN